jgi:hypothetical protein
MLDAKGFGETLFKAPNHVNGKPAVKHFLEVLPAVWPHDAWKCVGEDPLLIGLGSGSIGGAWKRALGRRSDHL